jgi:hypothetical protein
MAEKICRMEDGRWKNEDGRMKMEESSLLTYIQDGTLNSSLVSREGGFSRES